jgi:hypothetical protein
LTGGTVDGRIAAKGMDLNPITFPSATGGLGSVFTVATGASGTVSNGGVFGWNEIDCIFDTMNATGSSAIMTDMFIQHRFGGVGFHGGRQPLTVSIQQTGPVSDTPGAPASVITGMGVGITLTDTFGGTGLTSTTATGFASVVNPYLKFDPGFRNGGGGSVMELDYSRQPGSSFLDFIAMLIAGVDGDTARGTRDDFGIAFVGGGGLKSLISTGASAGYPGPIGSFWTVTPHAGDSSAIVANKGLDWSRMTFTTSAIETPGFLVNGSGDLSSGNVYIGSSLHVATALGAGADFDIITPNGSNIVLVPQGNGSIVARTSGSGRFHAEGAVILGAGDGTVSPGEVGLTKITASGTAPGTGLAKFAVVAGTTAGTAKLIMYAGSSGTPVTVIDNVGAGF